MTKMTREEEKRYRRAKKAFAFACVVLMVMLLLCLLLVPAKSSERKSKDRIDAGTPMKEAAEIQNKEAPDINQQDFENEKIEAALKDQGYYSDAIPLSYDLQGVMRSAAETYKIPYSLALAVCQTESEFTPGAKNGSSTGYMQVKTMHFTRLGKVTGYDPKTPDGNIVCGVCFLAEKVNAYRSIPLGLMAYNCGDGGAARKEKKVMADGLVERFLKEKAIPRYIDGNRLDLELTALAVAASKVKSRVFAEAINLVELSPTADVAPVVHGQWEPVDPEGDVLSRCSRCGRIISSSWGCCEDEDTKGCNGCDPSDEWLNCPTCGALMDGKDEDNG